MTTHLSYKVSKKLKEFLGESAPEPMDGKAWNKGRFMDNSHGPEYIGPNVGNGENLSFYSLAPAYQLHDVLSKPFCKAFIKERFARGLNYEAAAWELTGYLERMINEYYKGGLPAVEKALEEMMK